MRFRHALLSSLAMVVMIGTALGPTAAQAAARPISLRCNPDPLCLSLLDIPEDHAACLTIVRNLRTSESLGKTLCAFADYYACRYEHAPETPEAAMTLCLEEWLVLEALGYGNASLFD